MTTDGARIELGKRLAEAREAKELTQEQVGARFGVGKGTVSAWEKGRGIPDALRLADLARLYTTTPDALLGRPAPSHAALEIAADFDSLSDSARAGAYKVWKAIMDAGSGEPDSHQMGDMRKEGNPQAQNETARNRLSAQGPQIGPALQAAFDAVGGRRNGRPASGTAGRISKPGHGRGTA